MRNVSATLICATNFPFFNYCRAAKVVATRQTLTIN